MNVHLCAAWCSFCCLHGSPSVYRTQIDAAEPLPTKYKGLLLMSVLVTHVISASIQNLRFSQLYFLVSVIRQREHTHDLILLIYCSMKRGLLYCLQTKGHHTIWSVLAGSALLYCHITDHTSLTLFTSNRCRYPS
jgi:hypothetical protein